ncbi:MAG: NAD-dependent epimerase/dehydratase, partial [Acidobacteria bacterium]|nr:NAD-dependent epimerase/dehydratase [Acidobacteriota bacterium]
GHRLTLFNRGRRPKEWPGEVEELSGDRNTGDLEALKGREWDVCIDNPTTLPYWVRDAGQVLAGKVGQYVFISTVSVYAKENEPGADESAATAEYKGADAMKESMDAVRASNFELYGPLKATSEREAEKWFPGATTVIRPGLIVGPGDETDRFTYWPVRLERGGEVLAPGDGSDPVQVIDARDLAPGAGDRRPRPRGVDGADGRVPHPGDVQRGRPGARAHHGRPALRVARSDHLRSAHHLGSRSLPGGAEGGALERHAGLGKVAPWSDMPVWVPAAGDTLGFGRRSNARALAAGLTYRPLARTTLDTLDWFHALPAERRGQLRAGIAAAREAEVLAAWRAKKS